MCCLFLFPTHSNSPAVNTPQHEGWQWLGSATLTGCSKIAVTLGSVADKYSVPTV